MTSSISSLSKITPASAAKAPIDPRTREAAEKFEAYMLRQMLSSMRAGALGNDIFGSEATGKFQEMSDAQLADTMSKSGGMGFADMLARQLSQTPSGQVR